MAYGVVCVSCFHKWRAEGHLIETDEQEEQWFAACPSKARIFNRRFGQTIAGASNDNLS